MLAYPTNPWTSIFADEAQENKYNQWLNDKVAHNLADTRPNVPHDLLMARLDAILGAAQQGQE